MFTLIHKHLPDINTGEIKYSAGHKTYLDRDTAEKDADIPRRQNLPYRSKVIEIENPFDEE